MARVLLDNGGLKRSIAKLIIGFGPRKQLAVDGGANGGDYLSVAKTKNDRHTKSLVSVKLKK